MVTNHCNANDKILTFSGYRKNSSPVSSSYVLHAEKEEEYHVLQMMETVPQILQLRLLKLRLQKSDLL